MTIAVAAAVAVAVALVSIVAYLAVRGELRAEVDRALQDQLDFRGGPPPGRGRGAGFGPLPAQRGGPTPYIQVVDAGGANVLVFGSERDALPVDDRVRDVAAGVAPAFLADAEVDGTHVRVLTTPARGGAAQLGRSLEPADAVLRRMRLILLVVFAGGVALAVVLGRIVSRNVVAPIAHVTEAARHIAATEDLGRRIEVETNDEIGELAEHFNAMLDTLERSVAAQRQLVADASHELRTPITSLRTNIEVLAESDSLPADERARLLADVEEQTTELGMLVADLIELARGDEPRNETEDVRLDELVTEAIVRARRHAPHAHFSLLTEPSIVAGVPDRLGRAVNNLLDNAAQHSDRVEVRVGADGTVAVRDHGPGVPAEDADHVFDRFYRGATARGRTGSGLGLAIVRQVAEAHGGSVRVESPEDGGARFVLALPGDPA
jgi:two-component system sensor histidine kinase MprB